MIELLEFAFRGPWTFAGCFALVLLVGAILSALGSALKEMRPFQGIVQVNAPNHSLYTDKRRRLRSTTINPADVLMHATLEAEHDSPHTEQSCKSSVEQHGMSNSCPEPGGSVER